MSRRSRLAVGLMSGTSVDGIDAALVQIEGTAARPRLLLRRFITLPYPPVVRRAVLRLAGGEPAASGEISELNFLLGELSADAALAVCRKARVSTQQLTVIGSHGQTMFHRGQAPSGAAARNRFQPASTLQIGEPAIIAERTGAPVVADFRVADMAAGGEGAPLVPMVDYLLLRHKKLGSIALNVGGIANVTAIPAGCPPEEVFGFDTGPGNMLMDSLVRHFSRGTKSYDKDGAMARQGRVIEPLLARALRITFFHQTPPKSAGREQFGHDFLSRYFLKSRSASQSDLLCTATELTAQTVAGAIDKFVFSRGRFHRLIVSGGGAHNRFLMERLRTLLPGLTFHSSTEFGLPVDAKEAMAFALLADRTLHGLPGNLPAVTGARHAVILGKLVRSRARTARQSLTPSRPAIHF